MIPVFIGNYLVFLCIGMWQGGELQNVCYGLYNATVIGLADKRLGEIAAAMILEESVLKALQDAEDAGEPITDLQCLYPEDGVILIPSTVMTVAQEHSHSRNVKTCEEVERWFLSEAAQKLILKGYMHSVFRDMREIPRGSVSTDELIEKDMGVNWEAVYRGREDINLLWTEIVANR